MNVGRGRGASFAIPQRLSICYADFHAIVPMVSILVACLALNAETIQGEVVRVVESRPFNKLEAHRIVVKNVNHFGDEMMRLFRVPVNK